MRLQLLGTADRADSPWIDSALRAHEDRTLTRVTIARTAMFATIWLWLLLNYGPGVALDNAAIMGLFVGFGLAAYRLMHGRPDRLWLTYPFVVLDGLLLGYTLLSPGRTYPEDWPWQSVLRQPSFLYALTIPALAVLSFRPFLVVWAGTVMASVWAVGTWLIARAPGAVVGMADLGAGAPDAAYLGRYFSPNYVHPDDAFVRIFVLLLLVAILAYAAARARNLVFEQAEVARERANLARYVAPSMVDRLARSDKPMAAVRRQDAAVLFADLRGFTALAETLGPEGAMALLRDFHARMARCVFAQAGTLDKFIGDGLMATFGTPETAPDDARRALACAEAMLSAMTGWNDERRRAGLPTLAIGIGLHYGPVTMGDIGGERRFEFAVIGDTVNVANRLERLTRSLGSPLLVSGPALEAAIRAGADGSRFAAVGERALRGRASPLQVWSWQSPEGTAAA